MNTTPAAMCVTSAVKYFWMVTQSKWRSRNQEREGGGGGGRGYEAEGYVSNDAVFAAPCEAISN